MKHTTILFLSAVILFTAPACRKGEDDPFLSLISRQNRLEGTWQLKQGTMNASQDNENFVFTTSTSMTADSMTITMPDGSTVTQAYKESLEFKDNGTFNLTSKQYYNNAYELETVIIGTWEFLDKSGDYRNKERVRLIPETQTNNADETEIDLTALNYDYVLFLSRLAKDKLEFDYEYTLEEGTNIFSATGSKKYEKK